MYKQFSDEMNFIEDGTVFANGEPIGLLVPSTLFGYSDDGTLHVCGRQGVAQLGKGDGPMRFWEALIASDCILFGEASAIKRCKEILADPVYSRTFSYLATVSATCEDLLRRLALIRSSSVLVLGCGGIGSLAALNVAGAGVKSVTLVDHDHIELSNLNRQFLWTTRDIGCLKVEVLRSAIEQRFPCVEVTAVAATITVEDAKRLSRSHDVIIVSADEPLGLGGHLSEECRELVVYGAYFQKYWGYFASKNCGRVAGRERGVTWVRSPGFIGPSFGPGNTEIAGAISAACMHYLCERDRLETVDLAQIWCGDRVVAERR
ncbi:ThiF family adenylyltransferase [Cupriavidus pampae]|uniref:THIF-type NAD/FAD binding fold domain-containing protein n=1 Tax=Cupriavidus pampae TaxID=659251 RepID=A0ABM8XSN2_9BURK|nr:ThiF family adenylyltransferase [Cupriavidus pampae]CAG9183321.1 hypothetical protein LMG32289_05344 [Cupriavidus pampae]